MNARIPIQEVPVLVTLAVFAGLALLLLLLGWCSAESRPGFLHPDQRFTPFAAPIRLDADDDYR